jgi:hypothetical protein
VHVNEVEDIEVRATKSGLTRLFAADTVADALRLTKQLEDKGWIVWWA